jgi:hypothetical protein
MLIDPSRIRRVKCDEGSPSCRRCSSTGRICDGYAVPASSKTSPPPPLDNTAISLVQSSKPARPCGLSVYSDDFGSNPEQRSFHFFCVNTAPQLTGLFESSFWDRFVLQAAHYEPAVRHAAIALGALHENTMRYGLGNWEKVQGTFALQEYLKAINILVQPLSQHKTQALDVTLMSCVLFTCFDVSIAFRMLLLDPVANIDQTMRGHYGSALSHIDGGVKILSEAQRNNNTNNTNSSKSGITSSAKPYVSIEDLTAVLTRLDTQATQIAGYRPLSLYPLSSDDDSSSNIPAYFRSLTEARNCFDHLWHCVTYFASLLNSKDDDFAVQDFARQKLRDHARLLSEYSDVFEDFVAHNSHDLNARALNSIRTLKVQQLIMYMMLHADRITTTEDETTWDHFIPQMEEIVSLSAAVIAESARIDNLGPTFTLDGGIVVPLFLVASKCRNKVLRRKAMDLMASQQRQEGLWDSKLVGRVMERVVAIEESGLVETDGEDIPTWARVGVINAQFDIEGRRAMVTYERTKARDNVVVAHEEWISW